MKKVIFTEKAPAAIGPYSQAIEANGMVFLSGQLPVDPTVFLADMSLFAEMNAVYAKYFEGDFPARSAIAVKALPKGALVEIESIAAK